MNRFALFLFLGLFGVTAISCGDKASQPTAPTPSASQPPGNHSSNLPPPASPMPALAISEISPNTDLTLSENEEVIIQGTGFDSSVKVYADDEEIIPYQIGANEIRFKFRDPAPPPEDYWRPWDHWGAVQIKIKAADARETSVTNGFYFFRNPSWKDLHPASGSHFLDMAVQNGRPYLAAEKGIFGYESGQWSGLALGPDVPGFCPSLPATFSDIPPPGGGILCSLPIALAPLPSSSDLIALMEFKFCWDCDKSAENRLVLFHDGTYQTAIADLPGQPYAIRSTPTGVYALTTQGVYSSTNGTTWNALLSKSLTLNMPATSVPLLAWPFDIFETTAQIQIFIGTSTGIYLYTYNRSTHAISPAVRIGPAVSPPITALAVDAGAGRLYFAYAPSSNIPSMQNGGLGLMEVASIASAPVSQGVSLAPWTSLSDSGRIQTIIPTPTGTFVIAGQASVDQGWHPEVLLSKNSELIKFAPSLDTASFAPLPSGISENIPFLDFENGKTYLFLENRNCLLQVDEGKCLGEDPELGHQYVQFLLVRDGELTASTATDTYQYDDAQSIWHLDAVPADYREREDLQFSSLKNTGDILDWPITCALELPEREMAFACTPEGIYVRYQTGRWSFLGKAHHIRSLVYDAAEQTLYGASPYRGVLRMTLPY